MLEVRNPLIDVDEIMSQIQEKVRRRRAPAALPEPARTAALEPVRPGASRALEPYEPDSNAMHRLIETAASSFQVGAELPPMSRTRGLKRLFAVPVAKTFLRVAQLITRDQRVFNQSVLDTIRILWQAVSEQPARVT